MGRGAGGRGVLPRRLSGCALSQVELRTALGTQANLPCRPDGIRNAVHPSTHQPGSSELWSRADIAGFTSGPTRHRIGCAMQPLRYARAQSGEMRESADGGRLGEGIMESATGGSGRRQEAPAAGCRRCSRGEQLQILLNALPKALSVS
jgi:hypothetical protein